jgi:prepilin-type N-terminal cleavage/methylation domain-containing protein
MKMPVDKTLITNHSQRGVTLIELLISTALGLLIMAAATAMTVKSLVMNTDTLASARLNQDLDSVTQVMVNDIRRAGFTGGVFFYADNEDLNIVSSSCILYAYDADEDGVRDNDEKFGFRLNTSEVQMRTTCAAGDTCATDCTTGTWVSLTDNAFTTISNLAFTSERSKCIAITDSANLVANSNTNNYWVTTSAATQFPCTATSGTGLTNYTLDSSDVYVSGTFVAPQTGDRLIGARLVNVDIDANLTSDNNVTKDQEVDISVRNDHLRCVGLVTCPLLVTTP